MYDQAEEMKDVCEELRKFLKIIPEAKKINEENEEEEK